MSPLVHLLSYTRYCDNGITITVNGQDVQAIMNLCKSKLNTNTMFVEKVTFGSRSSRLTTYRCDFHITLNGKMTSNYLPICLMQKLSRKVS